jgi:hypothetical protein
MEEKKSIKLDDKVEVIELLLSPARLIAVTGYDKRGKKQERHLKITDKGKMSLM